MYSASGPNPCWKPVSDTESETVGDGWPELADLIVVVVQRADEEAVLAAGERRVPRQIETVAELQVVAIDQEEAAAIDELRLRVPDRALDVPP